MNHACHQGRVELIARAAFFFVLTTGVFAMDAMESGHKAAFTVNEFCVRFGICRSLFYAEVRAGRLKTRKAGRRTLVLTRDADSWAEALPEGRVIDAAA